MRGSSGGDMGAALAGMAKVGNPRIPMDAAAVANIVNTSGQGSPGGTSKPRAGISKDDPAVFPTATRKPTIRTGETGGARYGIRVGIPILANPAAGPTQKNGRVIQGRGTGASFWGGSAG